MLVEPYSIEFSVQLPVQKLYLAQSHLTTLYSAVPLKWTTYSEHILSYPDIRVQIDHLARPHLTVVYLKVPVYIDYLPRSHLTDMYLEVPVYIDYLPRSHLTDMYLEVPVYIDYLPRSHFTVCILKYQSI